MDEDKADDRGLRKEQEGSPMIFSFTSSRPKFSASRPPLFPRGKNRSGQSEENKVAEFVTSFKTQRLLSRNPTGLRRARVVSFGEKCSRPEKRMKNVVMDDDDLVQNVILSSGPTAHCGIALGVKEIDSNIRKEYRESTLQRTCQYATERPNPSFTRWEDQNFQGDGLCHKDSFLEIPSNDFREVFLRGMGWEAVESIRPDGNGYGPREYLTKIGWIGVETESNAKESTDVSQMKRCETGLVASDVFSFIQKGVRSQDVGTVDDEADANRKRVIKGKVMSIISGRHLGLRGEVLDSEKLDQVAIMLVQSGQKVFVSVKDLADIGSLEEEKVIKQIRQLNIGNPSEVDHMHMGSANLDADNQTSHRKQKEDTDKKTEGQAENMLCEDKSGYHSLRIEFRINDHEWNRSIGDSHRNDRINYNSESNPAGNVREEKIHNKNEFRSEEMDAEDITTSSIEHELGEDSKDELQRPWDCRNVVWESVRNRHDRDKKRLERDRVGCNWNMYLTEGRQTKDAETAVGENIDQSRC